MHQTIATQPPLSSTSKTSYIVLGSNLDNPVKHINTALLELAALPHTRSLGHSRLFRSPPMGPQNQPDFINAAIALDTRLSPIALLRALQTIENRHHRSRGTHWGPRTLDLDIVLYGEYSIKSRSLCIPHPGLTTRAFFLLPLADIAPLLVLPDGRTVQQHIAAPSLDTTAIIALDSSTSHNPQGGDYAQSNVEYSA